MSSSDSESSDEVTARAVTWKEDATEQTILLSFWNLISGDAECHPGNLLELEAATEVVQENPNNRGDRINTEAGTIVEVALYAEDNDCNPEVSGVQQSKRISHSSRKNYLKKTEHLGDVGLFSLSKLFDKNLLAELVCLRHVIERIDQQGFDLMVRYTNSLWSQMSVIDDCILVDNRLAVPGQLRPAVIKQTQPRSSDSGGHARHLKLFVVALHAQKHHQLS